MDLERELARRRQHESAGLAARTVNESMEDWQQECCRFTAPGHGAGEHVKPFQRRWDGLGLYRGRTREPEFLDSLQECRVKLQAVEWHGRMITARREGSAEQTVEARCLQVQLVRYTLFNDCSDQCATGAQPALSLRLGPQIQTLLSREGRRTGGCRPGQSRSGSGCSIARGGHVGSHTSTKAPDAPALEGDHFSWLRPAHADAT